MSGELRIRAARETDAAALLSIYEPYVRETTITFEHIVPTLEEFQKRICDIQHKFPYFVAERDGVIVGYAYASTFRTRAAYGWTVETSVYVRMGAHRGGVGTALYGELEHALAMMNVKNLIACITYPNPESVGFHARNGYTSSGILEKVGYKAGKWLDIIWMQKFLGEHEVPPSAVTPYPEVP